MFGFPYAENNEVFSFRSNGVVTSSSPETEWTAFSIPPGTQLINILAIGGGSGGGSGLVAATSAVGGGGGGSAASYSATYLAKLLPSTIYIKVGRGSVGGTGNGQLPAGGGEPSLVATQPIGQWTGVGSNYSFFLLAVAPGGQRGATYNATGAGGASLGSASILGFLSTALLYSSSNGSPGGAGGTLGSAGFAASGVTTSSSNMTCAGSGGGGVNSSGVATAGGNVISAMDGFIGNSILGGAAGGNRGLDGTGLTKPPFFYFIGGTGGGGGAGVAGGAGGNGSFGCGGGGGGGSTTTSGNGGDGGSGLVVISCW
jgi:hypothetical protein